MSLLRFTCNLQLPHVSAVRFEKWLLHPRQLSAVARLHLDMMYPSDVLCVDYNIHCQ